MAPAPTPAPQPNSGTPTPPPAATPKPIDPTKATAAIQRFRDAVAASAADKIADVEGAKAARSALSAAVSEIKSAGDWSETRLIAFANAASISADELRNLLSTMSANATNLSNAFDTQFTSVLGAGDATKKLAASLNDAALGQALGSTVVELDKVILRMQNYAKVASDTAKLGANLKGGVGGTNLELQKNMFKSGLLDDEMAEQLHSHMVSMSGHIMAQKDSLTGMWKATLKELETLGAQKEAIEEQLVQLGVRKTALDKEQAERAKTLTLQQASARASKEKELAHRERELAVTEQGINARQTALEATRTEIERLRTEARGLEGDAKKAVVDRQKQLEREYFAKQEVVDKDKEGVEAKRAEIASERAQIAEGLRLASDRTALEAERAALTERSTLAEAESARIADEKTKLEADKVLHQQRLASMTEEEKTSQQAILDARQAEIAAKETANNTEKAAIENKKKETAMALLLYQDKAAVDAERLRITTEQQALASDKNANVQEQARINILISSLNRDRANLSAAEIASREAQIADKQAQLAQKTSNVTEREALLAERDRQNTEANRLYTDRTALDTEITSLNQRERAATVEEAAIQAQINQLAADRAALAQQTNLTAEQRAAKEAEFAAKDRELASRNNVLTRERQLIAEQNIELQRSDAIVRANEREAIRKANEAAVNKEFAARREALNSEEERVNEEKNRLNSTYIESEKQQQELLGKLKDIDNSIAESTENMKLKGTKWIEDFRSVIGNYSKAIEYQNAALRVQDKWTIFEGNNLQMWRDNITAQQEEIKQKREEIKRQRELYELQKNSAEGLSEAAQAALEASFIEQEAALRSLEASVEKGAEESSPITQAFQNAIKPLIKEVKRTADYQDARFNLIGDVAEMGWFNARTEAKKLKDEEKFFAERKKQAQKEMDMLKAQNEAGMITNEEFQTSFAVAAKDLKEFADAEKTTKSRRKQVEERVEKGMLGNQLEKLNKAMSKMADSMKKAAGHWITKVLGLLVFLGFLIGRGILSPSRIAKTIALLVDFVVKGLKALFKLLIIGLIAVVKSIFLMFAQGNILAGVISALVFVIVSLLVLAHLINLASIGWAKIAGAATTISSAFMTFSDGLKKLSGIDLAGFFDELGNKMKDGFKKMFGMVTDKVAGAASSTAQQVQAPPKYKNLGTKAVVSDERKAQLAAMTPEQRQGLLRDKLARNRGFADQREAARMASVAPPVAPAAAATPTTAPRRGLRDALLPGRQQTAPTAPGTGVAGAATVSRGAGGGAIPSGAGASAAPPKGASKFSGFLKGLADSLKELGSAKVLRGAATLALLATAVMMIAAAFVLFSKVSWEGVAIGLIAIFGLVQLTKMLSRAIVHITLGSLALKQLSIAMAFFAGSLLILALAMQAFNSVNWGSLLKAGIAIVMFSFLMIKIVPFAPLILAGAYTIALVGLALLPLVFAMNFMKGFEFKSLIVLGLGIYTLALLVSSMAFLLPWVILGGITIAALGLALMPMVIALQMAKGLQLGGALVLVVATYLFAEIGYALAEFAKSIKIEDIIKASLMIGSIGLSLIPMAIALQMAKGIQLGSALILVTATFLFGSIAYGLALLSKLVSMSDVIKGGLMIGMIGIALIPMASALLMANGISLGAAILLVAAVTIFGSIAYSIALLSKLVSMNDVIKGGLIIGLIGLAMIPLATALHLAKGITLGSIFLMLFAVTTFGAIGLVISNLSSTIPISSILKGALIIALIGLAVLPMAWALNLVKGVKISEAFILITAITLFLTMAGLLGSPWMMFVLPMITVGILVIAAIGAAVLPMAKALSLVKGVKIDQVGILLAAVAGFAAIAIGIGALSLVVPIALILFGVFVIYLVGYAIKPMAESLMMVKGLAWDQMAILLTAVFGFSAIAIGIGALALVVPYPLILAGILAIFLIGIAIFPIAVALNKAKGIEITSVMVLLAAIAGLTSIAFYIGLIALGGAAVGILAGIGIILLIGFAIRPMAEALSLAKGLDATSVFVLVAATMGFAAIASAIGLLIGATGGLGAVFIAIGAGIIWMLGYAIRPMVEALSLAKGLEPESAKVIIATIYAMLAITTAIGLFVLGTLGFGALAIQMGANLIAQLGFAILPMTYALSLAKGLEPESAKLIITTITEMLNISMALGMFVLGTLGFGALAIQMGANLIAQLGFAILPMTYALSLAKGLEPESAKVVVTTIAEMLNISMALGMFVLGTLGFGALAMRIAMGLIWMLGFAILPMTYALSLAKGLEPESAKVVTSTIEEMLRITIALGTFVLGTLGFGALMITVASSLIETIGHAIRPMVESLALAKGLEPESIDAVLAAVWGFTLTAFAFGLLAVIGFAPIIIGAGIIWLMGYAIRPMIEALALAKGLEPESIDAVLGALWGFTLTAFAFGILASFGLEIILVGAGIIWLMGYAIRPMIEALSLAKGLEPESIDAVLGALWGFTLAAFAFGILASFGLEIILVGAGIIWLMGYAIRPMVESLALAKGLEPESIDAVLAAVWGFTLTAFAFGILALFGLEGILVGAGIIWLMGYAIRPMIEALALAKGLEPESINAVVEATWGFVKIAMAIGAMVIATLGFGAGAIAIGAGIIWMLGYAIIPMAYALSLAKGLSVSDLDILELAIWRFLGVALSLAWFGLFLPQIYVGTLIMGIVGEAVIPMAEALSKVKGLDVASVEALAFATFVLVNAAVFAGSYFMETMLGSLVLLMLGFSISSLAEGISKMKGLTVEDALGMRAAIYSLVDGAVYAGQNFLSILLGAWALSILGEAISVVNKDLGPFAENLSKLAGLPEPLLKLAESLEKLGVAIRSFGGEIGALSDEEISKIVQITGSVSSSSSPSSTGGGVMEEIRDILKETKEIHVQQGGNNVVAMNQSNVSSNTNKQEAPIVKSTSAVDRYFSRLAFKHHIC